MVFTPGKWWSIIPIGLYALMIAYAHSGFIHDRWIEGKDHTDPSADLYPESELDLKGPRAKKKTLISHQWNENDLV